MNSKFKKIITPLLTLLVITSCSTDKNFKSSLEKTLTENPEIITDLIKNNPEKFLSAFQDMAKDARKNAEKNRLQQESDEIETYLKNPMKFNIRKDELIRGTKGAPITIVEYSDFQCPFCAKGAQIITELLKKYDGKIAFVYKHLPIDSIHPGARIASKYYEAIRITDGKKAFEFHDTLLENQQKLRLGEKYLESIVKDLGLNTKKIKALANSEDVAKRIEADEKEASTLGFSGTPGFLVNGIPVRGAYPIEHFDKIIGKILKI